MQTFHRFLVLWLLLSVSSASAQDTAAQLAADALQQIQNGNYQSATALVQHGLARFPNDTELWNLLGIAKTELHQPDSARTAFERGLQLAPNSISLNENLGFVFYRTGDYVNAKKYLTRAVSLGSDKPGVAFSLAASRFRTGEQKEALSALKSLEPALSGLGEYWEERGRAELLQDPSAAEMSFERAIALSPGRAVALNGAATAAEKQGLDEKALAYLIKARQANPTDVLTLAHFGSVCIRRDLGPDALDALKKAHELQPSNTSVLYLLARAHIAVQDWQEALNLFSEFSKREPGFAPAYYAKGWLDIKLARPQDARRELEHCLSIAPDMRDPRYELAQLDLDEGQLGNAERLLRRLLIQQPDHAKANIALGDLMMRKRDLPQAQTYLETAIRADPNSAAAHYKLSLVLFREHQTSRAEQEKAIAATLSAQANAASKTQLRLVLPEPEVSSSK